MSSEKPIFDRNEIRMSFAVRCSRVSLADMIRRLKMLQSIQKNIPKEFSPVAHELCAIDIEVHETAILQRMLDARAANNG